MRYNTFNIITIGCQMNKSDSERLVSYLKQQGLWTASAKEADLNIINTCGVRQSAEDRVYGLVGRIKKENPKTKIIITGCLSKREDVKERLNKRVDLFLPIAQMLKIDNFLQNKDKVLEDNFEEKRQLQGEKYLKITPEYSKNYFAYVPIGNGCNNFCAYCVVPYARGREVYRPKEEIMEEVKDLVDKGYKEITLVAQNVNSYKYKDTKFHELLEEINNLEGDFWIRFSTSHPKDVSDKLVEKIGKLDKVCNHLHLAVQSGDNEILKLMNRKYTVEKYKELIAKVRKTKKGIAITTDLIVGYPSETKEQFEESVKLFQEMNFDMAYVSQYSPRPNTEASKLKDDVSKQEKRKREEEVMGVLRKTAKKNNEKYKGQEVKVLIDGKNKKGEFFGKTSSSKTVKFLSDKNGLTGKFVKVKINKIYDFGLKGKLIEVYE